MSTAVCEAPRQSVTAGAVVCEFEKVMQEWNFRPWREGRVAPPTVIEAEIALLVSAYSCSC